MMNLLITKRLKKSNIFFSLLQALKSNGIHQYYKTQFTFLNYKK